MSQTAAPEPEAGGADDAPTLAPAPVIVHTEPVPDAGLHGNADY